MAMLALILARPLSLPPLPLKPSAALIEWPHSYGNLASLGNCSGLTKFNIGKYSPALFLIGVPESPRR